LDPFRSSYERYGVESDLLGAPKPEGEGGQVRVRTMQPLEEVRAIADRVARSRGLEVWDIVSRREPGGQVIRVFIDRPGPAATPEESVSIEDCAEVSREMGTILDVEDPLPFTYTLEVSSPGLDRPLRGVEDYRRFAGRLAKVVVSEAVDNQKAFEGRLRGVEENTVLLEGPKGRVHRLPLRSITRGRLEVEF
jgi:ribosome maturation factor RimP